MAIQFNSWSTKNQNYNGEYSKDKKTEKCFGKL